MAKERSSSGFVREGPPIVLHPKEFVKDVKEELSSNTKM